MREIKFRGRRIHSDFWAYGDLITVVGGNDIRVRSKISDLNAYHIPVDPDTVGQFTGLRDSDGRDIYEGDIVSVREDGEEQRHEVRYMGDIGYPAFDLVPETTGWCCETSGFMLNCMIGSGLEVRVIGNIHDNPDLMEAEDARD